MVTMKKLFMLFVVSLFLISACSQQNVDNHYADGHSNEEDEYHDEVTLTGETKEFTMIARKWEFEPSEIRVNLGDLVDIHVMSEDVSHGFFLPDFDVNEMLEPGVEVNVEFVADKKGTFTFSCNVPCGRGHGGMRGTLIVE